MIKWPTCVLFFICDFRANFFILESVVSSSNVDVEIPDARPVCILKTKDDHTFELDEEALADILLQPEIRSKKVVVVCVAGAFRKGKSFLLNFLIRYLDRKICKENV